MSINEAGKGSKDKSIQNEHEATSQPTLSQWLGCWKAGTSYHLLTRSCVVHGGSRRGNCSDCSAREYPVSFLRSYSWLQFITHNLSATATQAFWIGTSYILANAVCQPFIASLSGVFGRREVYVPSVALFAVGSIVAATSTTIEVLLLARTMQGVGGSGIIALTIVIITDIVPLRFRPKYIAINSAAWAIGTITGPVLGGLFSQHSTWRWIFWIMLPFCGFGLATIPLVVRLKSRNSGRRVDWIGGLIFIPSLTAFLVAISWGGSQFPWSSWQTLLPLVLGVSGVGASLVWEKYARDPFLRPTLFQNCSAIASYGATICQGGLLYGALYSIPIYFGAIKDRNATMTGVGLLPILVSFVPASIVAAIIITRIGHFRWANWLGWVLVITGTGLFILWREDTPTVVWAVTMVVDGIGHGLVLTAVTTATQASARAEDAAFAASTFTFSRQLGAALAIPIVTSTLQNFMRLELLAEGLDGEIANDAVGYIRKIGGNAGIIKAYVAGLHGTFEVMTGIAGLGLLLSLVIKHMSMDQQLESEHVLSRSDEKATPAETPV